MLLKDANCKIQKFFLFRSDIELGVNKRVSIESCKIPAIRRRVWADKVRFRVSDSGARFAR